MNIHKNAEGLAEDVRYYGRWMRGEAKKRIGRLYPEATLPDGGKATVIAWLWARTVPSPDPRAKGAPVPLAASFILSSKLGKEAIVVPVVNRAANTWAFEVKTKPSAAELAAAKSGTKTARGANFSCLLTGAAISDTHVKAEAMAGRMGAALMAVVAEGQRGKVYLSPTRDHEETASTLAMPEVPEIDQPLPDDPRNFWTVAYGLNSFAKLFTARQLMALTTFSDLVTEARKRALADAITAFGGAAATDTRPLCEGGFGPIAYADATATYLAFALGKVANVGSTVTTWMSDRGAFRETFARQALPMSWDYAEANPLSEAGGSLDTVFEKIAMTVAAAPALSSGSIVNRAAQDNSFDGGIVVSTDPPYYDNIGYADLSDFFYVWMRRTLLATFPELFRRVVTPKANELVATPYRHGGKDAAEAFFLAGMKSALAGLAHATANVPVTIYYAFKQQENADDGLTSAGWSTFVNGGDKLCQMAG